MVKERGEDNSKDYSINKLILKKAINKKINFILSKAFISEKEVYYLIRSFFKKFLEIDYEFTSEELNNELRKIYLTNELQEKVKLLFKKISKVEYASKPFSKDELIRLLNDFKSIIDELIIAHYKKESSIMKRLGDNIHKFFSNDHKKMLKEEEHALSENERVLIRMNMLLDNSKRWSKKDLNKAKGAYKELLLIYNSLGEEKKKVFYKPVHELYNILNIK